MLFALGKKEEKINEKKKKKKKNKSSKVFDISLGEQQCPAIYDFFVRWVRELQEE